jgi:hypothetical protein
LPNVAKNSVIDFSMAARPVVSGAPAIFMTAFSV